MVTDIEFRVEALKAFNHECIVNKSGFPTSKWINNNPKYMDIVREAMIEKMNQNKVIPDTTNDFPF